MQGELYWSLCELSCVSEQGCKGELYEAGGKEEPESVARPSLKDARNQTVGRTPRLQKALPPAGVTNNV